MINNRIARRLIKNDAGSVLVMTVIFSMAIVLLGAAYLQYSDHYRRELSYHVAYKLGMAAAHAGMVKGMLERPSGGNYTSPLYEFCETDDGYRVDYKYKSGDGYYIDDGGYVEMKYGVYGLSYVASNDFGEALDFYCKHDMSTHSYADWLYITDKETQSYRLPPDDTLRFWGPDTLDGKVHSNDKLHFQQGNGYWPVFWAEVTSCSTRFSPVDADDFVHFNGGYRIPSSYLPFPLQADSVRKYNYYSGSNALGVPENLQDSLVTEITLLDADQGFIVRHRSQMGTTGNRNRLKFPPEIYDFPLSDAPHFAYPPNGALFIEGELWITGAKGTHFNVGSSGGQNGDLAPGPIGTGFEGELTIGASGDIIIADDVVYKSSNTSGGVPTTSPDVLGLISEKHILVWRNCAQMVKINAGLGAIGDQAVYDQIPASRCPVPYSSIIPVDGKYGTISVDGINCYGQTNPKTTLTIVGCLIQKERGLIHTTYPPPAGGERGFDSKDYTYDTRFRKNPPPHFFPTRNSGNYYYEEDPYGDQGGF